LMDLNASTLVFSTGMTIARLLILMKVFERSCISTAL
jgi:hypothetical protein